MDFELVLHRLIETTALIRQVPTASGTTDQLLERDDPLSELLADGGAGLRALLPRERPTKKTAKDHTITTTNMAILAHQESLRSTTAISGYTTAAPNIINNTGRQEFNIVRQHLVLRLWMRPQAVDPDRLIVTGNLGTGTHLIA